MKRVNILGDEFHVNAQIEILDSFSGHADHGELLAWYDRVTGPKQKTFLVHGEPDKSTALEAALREKYPKLDVSVASLLQEVVL
jgi:metallo-beta-lactamase family protein